MPRACRRLRACPRTAKTTACARACSVRRRQSRWICQRRHRGRLPRIDHLLRRQVRAARPSSRGSNRFSYATRSADLSLPECRWPTPWHRVPAPWPRRLECRGFPMPTGRPGHTSPPERTTPAHCPVRQHSGERSGQRRYCPDLSSMVARASRRVASGLARGASGRAADGAGLSARAIEGLSLPGSGAVAGALAAGGVGGDASDKLVAPGSRAGVACCRAASCFSSSWLRAAPRPAACRCRCGPRAAASRAPGLRARSWASSLSLSLRAASCFSSS